MIVKRVDNQKICVITSSYPRSQHDTINAGVFVKDFAEELMQKGNGVFVITPDKKGEKEKRPKVPVYFFPTIGGETELTTLDPFKPFDLFKLMFTAISGCLFTLFKLISQKPNAILAMWAIPSGLYAWFSKIFLGIPYSIWALGSDIWNVGNYPLGTFLLKKILKNADILLSDGDTLAQDVELISARECHFLPSIRRINKDVKRLNINLDTAKKHFLYIGRYHINKGIDYLLDSIAEIPPDERQYICFHIFGGGPLKDVIHQKCLDYRLEDCVKISGYADVPTVIAYLECCHGLIIPSRIESIPLIFSDAMQMRCPVIATDVGDMGNLIRQYKVGEIVIPLDKNSMIEAIRKMMTKKKSDYFHHFNKAEEYFSVPKSVDRFLKLHSFRDFKSIDI